MSPIGERALELTPIGNKQLTHNTTNKEYNLLWLLTISILFALLLRRAMPNIRTFWNLIRSSILKVTTKLTLLWTTTKLLTSLSPSLSKSLMTSTKKTKMSPRLRLRVARLPRLTSLRTTKKVALSLSSSRRLSSPRRTALSLR